MLIDIEGNYSNDVQVVHLNTRQSDICMYTHNEGGVRVPHLSHSRGYVCVLGIVKELLGGSDIV